MLRWIETGRVRRVLCLGAHCDDIEIGCGGLLLRLARDHGPDLNVLWAAFAGDDPLRAADTRRAAEAFLSGFGESGLVLHDFKDGYLPWRPELKDAFEALKQRFEPDLILTHARDDRHQDHRAVSDLTWNTWRSHRILEYEIPKYDGDLGRPNVFVALDDDIRRRKVELILSCNASQAGRSWFDAETFNGLMRLRGLEAGEGVRYAEGFTARKLVI